MTSEQQSGGVYRRSVGVAALAIASGCVTRGDGGGREPVVTWLVDEDLPDITCHVGVDVELRDADLLIILLNSESSTLTRSVSDDGESWIGPIRHGRELEVIARTGGEYRVIETVEVTDQCEVEHVA